MKSILLTWIFIFYSCLSNPIFSQASSQHSVRYMVTSDPKTAVLTAWVVPEYDTPNEFNLERVEKGATAQFSIEIPSHVKILEISDIVGNWEKKPYRFEDSQVLRNVGIDLKNKAYYVIGKMPTETTYGSFETGKPVALFTIKLDRKVNVNQTKIVSQEDEFVKIAYEKLSLNVASSFYSRSGQSNKVGSIPLEQFAGELKEKDWLKTSKEVDEESLSSGLVVFPNPFIEDFTLKYFFPGEKEKGTVVVSDPKGSLILQQEITMNKGLNELNIKLPKKIEGTVILKVWSGDWSKSRTLVKNK